MKHAQGTWYGTVAAHVVLLMAFALATAETVEAAARSNSVAAIYWSSPRLTVSPGMTVTFTDKTTLASSFLEINGADQADVTFAPDWGKSSARVMYESGSFSVAGWADTDEPDTEEQGVISSWGYASSNQGGDAYVVNRPHQTGTFTVSGTGTVTLEIPYVISVLAIAESLTEYATSVAEAVGVLADTTTNGRTRLSDLLSATVYGPNGQFSDKRDGTLLLSLPFDDGDTGYFMSMAHTEGEAYSVPEPSTFLLLGGGVAGLALLRRRGRGV